MSSDIRPKRKRRKMEPLEFVVPPDGRKSPKLPNKKRNGDNALAACKPVKRKRVSSNGSTKWIQNDGMVADPSVIEIARLRCSNRRVSHKEETSTVFSERRSSVRATTTKDISRSTVLPIKVTNEGKRARRRPAKHQKSIAITTKSKVEKARDDVDKITKENIDGERNSNDDVAHCSKDPKAGHRNAADEEAGGSQITSYFRVKKNTTGTSTRKETKKLRENAMRLFENFLHNGSDDSGGEDELPRSDKPKILAPDTPPDLYGVPNFVKREMERKEAGKKAESN